MKHYPTESFKAFIEVAVRDFMRERSRQSGRIHSVYGDKLSAAQARNLAANCAFEVIASRLAEQFEIGVTNNAKQG